MSVCVFVCACAKALDTAGTRPKQAILTTKPCKLKFHGNEQELTLPKTQMGKRMSSSDSQA